MPLMAEANDPRIVYFYSPGEEAYSPPNITNFYLTSPEAAAEAPSDDLSRQNQYSVVLASVITLVVLMVVSMCVFNARRKRATAGSVSIKPSCDMRSAFSRSKAASSDSPSAASAASGNNVEIVVEHEHDSDSVTRHIDDDDSHSVSSSVVTEDDDYAPSIPGECPHNPLPITPSLQKSYNPLTRAARRILKMARAAKRGNLVSRKHTAQVEDAEAEKTYHVNGGLPANQAALM